MQRLYRVLLLIGIATALAVYLRPGAAAELIVLTGTLGQLSHQAQQPGVPSPYPETSSQVRTPPQPVLPTGYHPSPAVDASDDAQAYEPIGEFEVSDLPSSPSSGSRPVSPNVSTAPPGPTTPYPAYPDTSSRFSAPPSQPWNAWPEAPVQTGPATTTPNTPPPPPYNPPAPPYNANLPSRDYDSSLPPYNPPPRGNAYAPYPASTPQVAEIATPAPVQASPADPLALDRPVDSKTPRGEASAEAILCEGAQILARVGSKVVLASEVMSAVNEIIARYDDKMPASQLEVQRKLLIRKFLEQRINTKLVYQDIERKLPAENLEKFTERLEEQYDLTEVPRLMKQIEAGSRQELEEKLRELGTSIERQKRSFVEQVVAHQWLLEQTKTDEEVSHEEMLAYYQEHSADFEHPARARWEQLMVRKSKFPSEAEARAALARMGNRVLQGEPFAEVAKADSQGPTAFKGGVWDWTTQGSLVSEVLDRAVFGLPIGQLSQILEDSQGFHIIRVVQREDAWRTPFLEAQVEIRKKIREQRKQEAREAYLARLREEIPVWTVFDHETVQAESNEGSLSRFLQR